MTARHFLARACLGASLLLIPAMAQAQSSSPPDSTAARLKRGKALFEGRGLCFSCHGKDGEGILGPETRLVGRPLVHTKATVADIAALIKTGVDSTHSTSGQAMPPMGGSRLTETEMNLLAGYVLELQKRKPPQ
jgi:mono/diheme cytochrome c family protein